MLLPAIVLKAALITAGQYQEEVPSWFQKYWHAHALNQLNLTVLFMDTDVAVFQDPFLFHDKSYDVEGLSDWNWLEEAPSHQVCTSCIFPVPPPSPHL